MVDLVERIEALLNQEEAFYTTTDYLDNEYQRRLVSSWGPGCDIFGSASESTSSGSSCMSGINEFWREKIVEWSYQVIDHFDFSREAVSVSTHYLDRFLSKKQVNKKMFQLAAMTCLFLAIKLHEPGRISMSSMIELSRGYFEVEQMKAMELEVLRVLCWHLHPTTSYCFAKHILFMVPYTSITLESRHDVLELARFLTELSVIDYFFVAKQASHVALASLANAMDEIPEVSQDAKNNFAKELQRVSGLSLKRPLVLKCRERLRLLYVQGGYSRPEARPETRNETISPVCVSYGAAVHYPSYGSSNTHQDNGETAKTSSRANSSQMSSATR